MNYLWAALVYTVIAFFLCWGILLAVRGQFMLLLATMLTYLLGLVLIGCLPKKTH